MNTRPLPSPKYAVVALAAGIVCLAAAAPAAAAWRGPYSMEVLVDGVPVQEYAARGTTYVEARRGKEYTIRLHNRTSERVAVALSVDGLNTIDARTTSAKKASKWILEPWQTITLSGWQTGHSTARRFFFTTEEDSYGSWLGKTRNLGAISAAFFREKRRRPMAIHKPPKLRREIPSPSPQESAPLSEGERRKSTPSDSRFEREPAADEDYAATGIGREYDHRVRRVRFDSEETPASVISVRYEYRDALVRLGVLPPSWAHRDDPLERRERARGFDDIEFAPDPYR